MKFRGNSEIMDFEDFEFFTNVMALEKDSFNSCINLKEIRFPCSLSIIGYGAFNNCTGLKNVELTSNITTLENRAFSNTGLTTFDTKNVQNTEWGFLYNNALLEEVYIGNAMESLAGNSFQRCPKLKKIVFEGGNTKLHLGGQLVIECPMLTLLVLPVNTCIIDHEFLRNSRVEKLYIRASIPPELKGQIQSNSKIYIPVGSLNAYKTAPNWSAYATDFEEYDFDVNPHGVE